MCVYLLIRKRAVLRKIPAISMAIVIIPNFPYMFNENITFLIKIFTTKTRRHKEYSHEKARKSTKKHEKAQKTTKK